MYGGTEPSGKPAAGTKTLALLTPSMQQIRPSEEPRRTFLNFAIDKPTGEGKLSQSSSLMPKPCKHPQVRVVAREEDVEFVECQLCGEVFDSAEFPDILNEDDAPTESIAAKDEDA